MEKNTILDEEVLNSIDAGLNGGISKNDFSTLSKVAGIYNPGTVQQLYARFVQSDLSKNNPTSGSILNWIIANSKNL